jgi:PhnB protein
MPYHPYLMFGGNCREAFTRYHEVFGGDLTLLTAADMPGEQRPDLDTGDLIMHAALVGDGELLMGSDDPTTDSFGPVQGMHVNYATSDVDEARRVFAALAEGGSVGMEPADTGWSPYFGMVTDRFGTPWMINAEALESSG